MLAESGLFGKIEFSSTMTAKEMRQEICRVFSIPMGVTEEEIVSGKLFPFHYLQRTGVGSQSPCLPAVSQSFEWSDRQVVTLAKSGGMIYILAENDLLGWPAPVKVCVYYSVNPSP